MKKRLVRYDACVGGHRTSSVPCADGVTVTRSFANHELFGEIRE